MVNRGIPLKGRKKSKIPILNAGRINYYTDKYRHMLGLLIKSGKKKFKTINDMTKPFLLDTGFKEFI